MPDNPARPARPAASNKTFLIAVLFVMQSAATLFFLVDAAADLREHGLLHAHSLIEALVAIALVTGTVFVAREMVRVRGRQRRLEEQLRAASGAFAELLEEHFESWSLTPSERDVALLAIKGLSVAEIARIRGTATGTVKAQSNAIYAKAGVNGRSQLLSLFIEELLAGPLVDRPQGT